MLCTHFPIPEKQTHLVFLERYFPSHRGGIRVNNLKVLTQLRVTDVATIATANTATFHSKVNVAVATGLTPAIKEGL
jgi:hypothetical protein